MGEDIVLVKEMRLEQIFSSSSTHLCVNPKAWRKIPKEMTFRTCMVDQILNCKLLCPSRLKVDQSHLLFYWFWMCWKQTATSTKSLCSFYKVSGSKCVCSWQDFGEENMCIDVFKVSLKRLIKCTSLTQRYWVNKHQVLQEAPHLPSAPRSFLKWCSK